MAKFSVFLIVLSITAHNATAQWNWGNRISNAALQANVPVRTTSNFPASNIYPNAAAAMLLNNRGRQQRPTYLTCIGRNTNGDEMRTSFFYEQRNANQWNNVWSSRYVPQTLRMFSLVSTNVNSQLHGEFQHVITEYSRVEDGCLSQALGDILTDRSWWGQNRVRGIIGTRITVYQGQSARSKEVIDGLQLNELIGRGLALCPVNQLIGSTCRDLIPLCCKIGIDSQTASPQNAGQVNRGQQQFGQFGMQNGVNKGVMSQSSALNMNGGNLLLGRK